MLVLFYRGLIISRITSYFVCVGFMDDFMAICNVYVCSIHCVAGRQVGYMQCIQMMCMVECQECICVCICIVSGYTPECGNSINLTTVYLFYAFF